MKKQATQLVPGDSVRVADVNLEGWADWGRERADLPTHAKVLRVERLAHTTNLKLAGIGWGNVRNDRGVRVMGGLS